MTLRVRPLATLRTPTTFVPGSLWLLARRSHTALAPIPRGLGRNLAVALTTLPVLSLVALHPGNRIFDLLREAPIVVPVALLSSLIELTLARLLGLTLPTPLGAVTMALLRGVLSIGLTELPRTARISMALLVITSLLALLVTASLLVRRLPARLLPASVLLGIALPASSASLLAATLLAIAFVLLCATPRMMAPLIVAALVLLVTALLLLAAPLLGAAVLSVAPMATLLLPGSLTSAALISLGPVGATVGSLFVL